MPSSTPYAPKHRLTRAEVRSQRAPRRAVRTSLLLTSVAAAATGIAVTSGVAKSPDAMHTVADGISPQALGQPTREELAHRSVLISRSESRLRRDPVKKDALSLSSGPAVSGREDLSSQDPRSIARALLPEFGFSVSQMSCLEPLWQGESGWRVTAENASSGAYGIPQSLPASKMATVGADYRTNPVTQIKWGLGYIRSSYGSPCGAWGFKQSHGWY